MGEFADEIWRGLGNAIDDIRTRAVEEPFFGRAVTDGPDVPRWPEPQEPEQSFGSHTHKRDMEPEREQQQDIDLDR